MSEQTTKTTASAEKNPPKADNVIAVASGKGGVGKTWFSVTLAQALAKQGKKVLLFDGDLGLANVDVQLGLMPKKDLNDVIEGNLTLPNAITTYEDGGFDIIAGRSGQASLSTLPGQRLHELMDQLHAVAKDYDAVIMDLGAGVEKTVRLLAASSRLTLIITNDEPTSLTDAYAFIKLSHAAGHADDIHIVVNMADTPASGEKTYETLSKACENFLKITPPLAGIIRADTHVKETIRNQTPLLTRYPTSEAAEDIEAITASTLKLLLV